MAVAYDDTPKARADRKAKLEMLAPFCWEHGLTSRDLQRMTPPKRRALVQQVLGRDSEGRLPGTPSSRTWGALIALVLAKEVWVENNPGDWRGARAFADDRAVWIDDEHDEHQEEPCPDSGAPNPAPATRGSRPPGPAPMPGTTAATPNPAGSAGRGAAAGTARSLLPGDTIRGWRYAAAQPLPPGWDRLQQLPPLDHGTCVHHADRAPVIITRDGGRCASCPPRRDEFLSRMYEPLPPGADRDKTPLRYAGMGMRDGWGLTVDWTPSECRWAPGYRLPGDTERSPEGPWIIGPVRCYCGRCPAEAYR